MAIKNTNLGGTDFVTESSTLNGAITDSDTTLTLTDASGFSSTGAVVIGAELIEYSGKSSNDLTGLTRGVGFTSPSAHGDASTVTETEKVNAGDVNDTFDAAYEVVASNPAFWLNPNLYDVYDDFESYAVGPFTTASSSKWTVNLTADPDSFSTASIGSSTNAGGTGKELFVRGGVSGTSFSGSSSAELIAEELIENRHVHMKLQFLLEHTSSSVASFSGEIKIEGSSYVTISSDSVNDPATTASVNTDLLVVAKGSDTYDVYFGGKKIFSDHVTATLKIYIKGEGTNTGGNGTTYGSWYIDDVVQSKFDTI